MPLRVVVEEKLAAILRRDCIKYMAEKICVGSHPRRFGKQSVPLGVPARASRCTVDKLERLAMGQGWVDEQPAVVVKRDLLNGDPTQSRCSAVPQVLDCNSDNIALDDLRKLGADVRI